MEFVDLVYKQKEEIEKCNKFIEFINSKFKYPITGDSSNLNNLLILIFEKKRLYKSLNFSSDISEKLEDINEQIFKQIIILRTEILNDLNSNNNDEEEKLKFLKSKYNVDKNIVEVEKLKKTIKNDIFNNENFKKYIYKKSSDIKKETVLLLCNLIRNNKWFSTFMFFAFGIIIFLAFCFFYNDKIVPAISQSELMYVMTMSSTIFILLPILFILAVFAFAYLFNYDKQNENFKNNRFMSESLFINVTSFIISIFITLAIIVFLSDSIDVWFNNNYHMAGIVIIILLCIIFRFSVFCVLKIIKNEMSAIFLYLTIIFMCGASFYLSIKLGEINKTISISMLFMSLIIFFIFFIDTKISKKENIILFIFTFIMLIICSTATFLNYGYKMMGFGDIDYKYITIDKIAKESLPKWIINKKEIKEYFCLSDFGGKITCEKENVEILSYKDGNITFQYNGNIKNKENISTQCLKFLNKNNEIIKIANRKIKFDDKTLIFLDNNDSIKDVIAKTAPEIYLTYIEDLGDVIKLYNIKAVSALGKYWRLKTKRNKDKFYIESKFIKGML
ncbi:hypothetical protein [Campylobacter hominis]|uniref:hypothetical protein n=1 Tax=Campylobacter hominis TaxID=76517 RepID=UPI00248C9CCB|nr:hypothetical protein [Campylobacter hominis]